MEVELVAVVVVLLGGAGLIVPWLRRRRAMAALNARESLSDDEVHRRYYASAGLQKDVVLELWHEVAVTLRVPPDKLRPEDRFGKEVGVYWITSEALDELASKGRKRGKASGLDVDLEKIGTVDGYIKTFARTA
jgi:hypothetical protein